MKKFLSKAAERHTVCAVCGSGDVGRFTAETAIHSLGMKQISKPAIFVKGRKRLIRVRKSR